MGRSCGSAIILARCEPVGLEENGRDLDDSAGLVEFVLTRGFVICCFETVDKGEMLARSWFNFCASMF